MSFWKWLEDKQKKESEEKYQQLQLVLPIDEEPLDEEQQEIKDGTESEGSILESSVVSFNI